MKAEIRKLRIENNDLMKRVRFADINAQYMRVRCHRPTVMTVNCDQRAW